MNISPELLKKIKEPYDITDRGFLPAFDPTISLPWHRFPELKVFDELGNNLPELLQNHTLEKELAKVPVVHLPVSGYFPTEDIWLLKARLDFLAHGYVHEFFREGRCRQELPANIAVLLQEVSKRLGVPPLLVYDSYALRNWKRKDVRHPIEPENLKLIQNFLGGESEEWFVIIHVAIVLAGAQLPATLWLVGDALEKHDHATLSWCFSMLSSSLQKINTLMRRMPEHCHFGEYFRNVRPYLYGWNKKEIFPNGMLYKGEQASSDIRLSLAGETGAEDRIFPALDRVFGVEHFPDALSEHLHDMLHIHTPLKPRLFVLELGNRSRLSEKVAASFGSEIEELYWDCRKKMAEFRAIHYFYAVEYIQKQAKMTKKEFEGKFGTGGTEFIPSLRKHFEETLGEVLLKKMGGTTEAMSTLLGHLIISE